MIGEGPALNENLSPALQEALDRALEPGEKPVIAVRGQQREALAATPTRLLTLRQTARVGEAPEVKSYPLSEVSDIALGESGPQAALTWRADGAAKPVTFSVPSYDVNKFRMVAEALRKMISSNRPNVKSEVAAAPAAAARCPKCSAVLPEQVAFCVACGLQMRDLCWDCGRLLETDWRFCPGCGADATELGVIPCPSCRQVVAREHAFCVHCGAVARPTCEECDRILRRAWQHCPDCGAPATADAPAGGRPAPARAAASARAERREPSTPYPEPDDVRPAAGSPEAEALNQQGIEAYEQERYEEAMALFRRAVALDPGNPGFHCNLAVACYELRRDDEAFAEYQQTLTLDPANARALVDLGNLYAEREQYEEARDLWERAIRVAPDSAEAGEARENLQNLEQL